MVLLQQNNNILHVAVEDRIITFNTNSNSREIHKIPEITIPPNLTKGQEEVLKNENRTISCLCFSKTGRHLAVATQNKQVVIYDTSGEDTEAPDEVTNTPGDGSKRSGDGSKRSGDGSKRSGDDSKTSGAATFKVQRNIVLNRAASKLCFTPQNDIIVADKTGEAYLYKLQTQDDAGTWLLGHNSMLLDVLVTDCGKYIITSDRDEKIRVSRFPNAYNIVCYCLGHREFVTNVNFCEGVLVSASGDGTVRTWNHLDGRQLDLINTNFFVKDKELINKFCSEMDGENVEIEALPIRDMQVHKRSDKTLIAVSIVNISDIQLYSLKESKLTFLNNVALSSILISFSLSETFCILTNKGFLVYNFKGDETECDRGLNDLYDEHKEMLEKTFSSAVISVLYKRKYDNVQEYLERKKLRLACK